MAINFDMLKWAGKYKVTHKLKDEHFFIIDCDELVFCRKLNNGKLEFWNEKTKKRTRLSRDAIYELKEI